MSSYLFAGLIVAVVLIVAYVVQASRKKRVADISKGLEIGLSTIGCTGGVKILVFVLTGEFSKLIKLGETSSLVTLKLSEEDNVFLFIGGIALIWINAQIVLRQFKELSELPPDSLLG